MVRNPFKSVFGASDPTIVESFEHSLECVLPSDYKRFLRDYNGGILNGWGHSVRELRHVVGVDVLFGLAVADDFDLRSWRVDYRDELPKDVIVIGGDPYGNLIVMSLTDHCVYFWDQLRAFVASNDAKNAYLLGECFTSFLETLVASPDPGGHIGPLGQKLPENIWHNAGSNRIQEINRRIHSEFSRHEGFRIAK